VTAFRRESVFTLCQGNRLGPGECWVSRPDALKEQPNSGRSMLPESRVRDQVADTLAGRCVEHQDSPPKINCLEDLQIGLFLFSLFRSWHALHTFSAQGSPHVKHSWTGFLLIVS